MKLRLIRGARILKQLVETSYAELEQNTKNFAPASTKRQFAVNQLRVEKLELKPSRESRVLVVKTLVNSEGRRYQPTIQFEDVIYEDSDQGDNVTFTGADREEYHILPVNLQKHNVKVHCTCLDFYYRFATHNSKDGSLLGTPPPPYQKKTDRPPVNLNQTPGVCKHLIRTVEELKRVGMIK